MIVEEVVFDVRISADKLSFTIRTFTSIISSLDIRCSVRLISSTVLLLFSFPRMPCRLMMTLNKAELIESTRFTRKAGLPVLGYVGCYCHVPASQGDLYPSLSSTSSYLISAV
jgi:hypothetical protein